MVMHVALLYVYYFHGICIIIPPPQERSITMSMMVCLCVCLSASISPELHIHSSPNFVLATCGWGSVLFRRRRDTLRTSGLRMTSCLHIRANNSDTKKRMLRDSTRGNRDMILRQILTLTHHGQHLDSGRCLFTIALFRQL